MSRALRWGGMLVAVTLVVSLLNAPTTAAAEIQVRWHRSIGARLAAVATDGTGRTVVAGSTRKAGAGRVLVRSLANDGTRLWMNTWRPTADSFTHGWAIDIGPAGRVLVAGDVWTPMDFDAPTTWFVRAYSRAGRVLWSRLAPGWRDGSRSASAAGVAAWPDGVVLAGSVCGEGGCEGGWIRSYTLDGSLRWVRSIGGIHGWAEDVAVTSAGVVYVTGGFKASTWKPPGEGDHPFVTMLRPDGTKVWTRRFAGREGFGSAIDVRRGGAVVSSVTSSGTRTKLVSLHADGSKRWLKAWRGRRINDVEVARTGRIWVTGRHGLSDRHAALFLRAYRPDGTLADTWLRDPGDLATWGTGVSVDPLGVSLVGSWAGHGRVWRLRT